MTSSQPVVTPNAINFTPDNKNCYSYSGIIEVNNTITTMLEFTTNSETLNVKIQFSYIESSDDNFQYYLYLNNVLVQGYVVSAAHLYTEPDNYISLIIPPFSTLKLSAKNLGSSTAVDQMVSLVGKVSGMIETEYQ